MTTDEILLIVVVIWWVVVMLPPRYDPAIRLKEWLSKNPVGASRTGRVSESNERGGVYGSTEGGMSDPSMSAVNDLTARTNLGKGDEGSNTESHPALVSLRCKGG